MMDAKRFLTVRVMVQLALLGAIAFVLTFVETPLPFFPSFLKLDPSDIPAVFATATFGPIGGVVVQLIKALLDMLKSSTAGVGQIANFVAGSAFAIPLGLIYRQRPTFSGFLLGEAVGVMCMVSMACMANYILLPLYGLTVTLDLILWTLAPFNLLKATLISVVCAALYVPLQPAMRLARRG